MNRRGIFHDFYIYEQVYVVLGTRPERPQKTTLSTAVKYVTKSLVSLGIHFKEIFFIFFLQVTVSCDLTGRKRFNSSFLILLSRFHVALFTHVNFLQRK